MVKRTALPVRLVVAFNKEKFKGIAKKILSNYTFVTSRRLRVRRLAAVERHALPSRGAKAGKGGNVPRRGTEL